MPPDTTKHAQHASPASPHQRRERRGAAQTQEYRCLECRKRFNRSDSLKRHRRIHSRLHQLQKSRRRACTACVRSKTRCNEAVPVCARCEQKHLECTYVLPQALSPAKSHAVVDADAAAEPRRTDGRGSSSRGHTSSGRDSGEPEAFREEVLVAAAGGVADAFVPLADHALTGRDEYMAASLLSTNFAGDRHADLGAAVPDAAPQTMPAFLGMPNAPAPHAPPSPPTMGTPLAWSDAAVSELIGWADFYPQWLRPYSVADEMADTSVSSMVAMHLRTLAPSTLAMDFVPGTDTAFDGAPLLSGSDSRPATAADGSTPALAGLGSHDVFGATAVTTAHHPPHPQHPPPAHPPAPAPALTQPLDTLVVAATSDPSAPTRGEEPPIDRLPELEPQNPAGDHYVGQCGLPALAPAAYKNLCDCLRVPLCPSPWQPMSLAAFPSPQQIDCFVDLYFGHFDWLLPMIHRPTFDPGADPVLTLSMCAVGVLYSSFVNAQAYATSLCELLRRLLLFMSEQSVAVSRTFANLAAQTLLCVLGNSSGSRRLFDFGDSNRGVLVAHARCVRLFDQHEPLCALDADPHRSLQARWEAWIQTERAHRLAWSIYIFDASATYYRNCRPNLSLSEMKVGLPCSADLWEAESAPAWAARQPWTHGWAPASPSLETTMLRLFSHVGAGRAGCTRPRADADTDAVHTAQAPQTPRASPLLSALDIVTDDFHRIILSTTLLRVIWDQREALRGGSDLSSGLARAMALAMADPGAGLASSAAATPPKPATGAVLTLLEELTTPALQPAAARAYDASHSASRSEDARGSGHNRGPLRPTTPSPPPPRRERAFQELVLRARVSLVAQIVAADQIRHHLDTAWLRRGDGYRRLPHDVAAHTLRAWADADPVSPRRMARVAAQLLAISRLYPFHMPREPYDTFRAGLLLWTMAPLVRSAWPEPTPSQLPRRVCLDWLGADDAPEAHVLRDWIEHGTKHGDVVLQIHGVPNINSEHGPRQILQHTSDVLRPLHVWGSSNTYRDIIARALHEGVR